MNSLTRRLERLEEANDVSDLDLISKIKKKQNEKKASLLNELTAKYLEYLENQSLIDEINHNLIEVLWYTIKYVEKNKLNIGRLLELKVTDDSFNDVVIHLIHVNCPEVHEDFISKGIKFLTSLDMKQEEIVEVISAKSKKSWFKGKKNLSE